MVTLQLLLTWEWGLFAFCGNKLWVRELHRVPSGTRGLWELEEWAMVLEFWGLGTNLPQSKHLIARRTILSNLVGCWMNSSPKRCLVSIRAGMNSAKDI